MKKEFFIFGIPKKKEQLDEVLEILDVQWTKDDFNNWLFSNEDYIWYDNIKNTYVGGKYEQYIGDCESIQYKNFIYKYKNKTSQLSSIRLSSIENVLEKLNNGVAVYFDNEELEINKETGFIQTKGTNRFLFHKTITLLENYKLETPFFETEEFSEFLSVIFEKPIQIKEITDTTVSYSSNNEAFVLRKNEIEHKIKEWAYNIGYFIYSSINDAFAINGEERILLEEKAKNEFEAISKIGFKVNQIIKNS